MKHFVARLLRRIGLLQFDLLSRTQPTYPEPEMMQKGEMTIVNDAGILKWACLLCPGGCGACLSLSLNRQRRPRWGVVTDFWTRPTVEPSVHRINDCGCHFWIRRGRVEWCEDGRPSYPKRARVRAPSGLQADGLVDRAKRWLARA